MSKKVTKKMSKKRIAPAEEPRVAKALAAINEIFGDKAIDRDRCFDLLEEIGTDVDAKLDALRDDMDD